MIKKWKNYSYIISLGISIIIVAGVYFGGLLPESILDKLEERVIASEHMAFMEKGDSFELGEGIEQLSENFSEYEGSKEEWTENIAETDNPETNDMTTVSGNRNTEDMTTVSREQQAEGTQSPRSEGAVSEAKDPQSEDPLKDSGRRPIEDPGKEADNSGMARPPEAHTGGTRGDTGKEPVYYTYYTGDASYFDDALFIGDSRTEGLREYGKLGKATVIADSGLSVYRLWKETYTVEEMGRVSLEEVLKGKHFGKIYLMLGVNELGYDFGQTVKQYEETLARIEEAQPEAIIYLQANLHVTEKKSNDSDVYNNDNINRINRMMEELAAKNQYIYLDVNPLFDDSKGNLSTEYTYDHAHILGVYYADWVNWILQHCV